MESENTPLARVWWDMEHMDAQPSRLTNPGFEHGACEQTWKLSRTCVPFFNQCLSSLARAAKPARHSDGAGALSGSSR
jgi:hypothetical protein